MQSDPVLMLSYLVLMQSYLVLDAILSRPAVFAKSKGIPTMQSYLVPLMPFYLGEEIDETPGDFNNAILSRPAQCNFISSCTLDLDDIYLFHYCTMFSVVAADEAPLERSGGCVRLFPFRSNRNAPFGN